MRNKELFQKKIRIFRRFIILVAGFFVFLCAPALNLHLTQEYTSYQLTLNGTSIGLIGANQDPQKLLREARRRIASQYEELTFVKPDMLAEKSGEQIGRRLSNEETINAMQQILKNCILQTEKKAYTVKINEFTVNLQDTEQVVELLSAAKNKYDTKKEYEVQLIQDPHRELSVLTAEINKKETVIKEKEMEQSPFVHAGVDKPLFSMMEDAGKSGEISLGLKNIEFGDNVEVVEAYLNQSEITPLENAVDGITQDKEKERIYEVQSGDTLSRIAEINETSMENLIALNENLENENSVIRVGDELTVTVPEPELSLIRTEETYYEGNYEAQVQYVDNDDWYTTDTKTLQDPIAGYRNVVADITYCNDRSTSENIVREDIVVEAVPKIVERGTKIPATYIKPISGGRISSTFGKRKAPKKGASTYHKGIDWATPVGTAVMASCYGTVSRAGWGSGYGYVVYIDHPDGRQTRYGHLSKLLVKVGQTVNQGDKIALSGNTGRSTGPHIHFEILIGGSQVNPLNYLN